MVPTIKIRSIFTTLNLDFLFKLNIIFYCYFNTILLKDHINHFPQLIFKQTLSTQQLHTNEHLSQPCPKDYKQRINRRVTPTNKLPTTRLLKNLMITKRSRDTAIFSFDRLRPLFNPKAGTKRKRFVGLNDLWPRRGSNRGCKLVNARVQAVSVLD